MARNVFDEYGSEPRQEGILDRDSDVVDYLPAPTEGFEYDLKKLPDGNFAVVVKKMEPACPYTHAHTKGSCGFDTCRSS